MPESKENLLVEAVKAQLEMIRVSNSYENDIPSVQRFQQKGQDFVDVPMIVVQWGEVNFDRRIGHDTVWEMGTIIVAVYMRHHDIVDSRSTDEILLSLSADIYRAVMQDRTLGGLSIDMFRASVYPDDVESDVPMVGHVSEFTVKYQHSSMDLAQ